MSLNHRDDVGNRYCGTRKLHGHGRHRQSRSVALQRHSSPAGPRLIPARPGRWTARAWMARGHLIPTRPLWLRYGHIRVRSDHIRVRCDGLVIAGVTACRSWCPGEQGLLWRRDGGMLLARSPQQLKLADYVTKTCARDCRGVSAAFAVGAHRRTTALGSARQHPGFGWSNQWTSTNQLIRYRLRRSLRRHYRSGGLRMHADTRCEAQMRRNFVPSPQQANSSVACRSSLSHSFRQQLSRLCQNLARR